MRFETQARVLAMQALALFDAMGDAFRPELNHFLTDAANREDLGFDSPPSPETLTLARSLAEGTWERRVVYDPLITAATPHWSLERMPPVERSVLRLALHELITRPETPDAVVLNEAIELARQFGGGESPAFINGVLDGVRARLAADLEVTKAPAVDLLSAPAAAASPAEEPTPARPIPAESQT